MTDRPNTPHHDMMLDAQLSMEAGTLKDKVNKTPQVRRIAVVGALFDKNYTLYRDDHATIMRAIKVLRETHIKLAKLVEFDFYNILAPLKNDFLKAALINKTAPNVDAVFVCGIWGGSSRDCFSEAMHPDQMDMPPNFRDLYSDSCKYGFRNNRELSISSLQAEETSWPEAAHQIGAKYVVTRGPNNDVDAINSNHFKPGGFYKIAIASEDDFEHVSGSISGSLGIMVRRDALDEIKSSIKHKSPLGQRIMALDDQPEEMPPPRETPMQAMKRLLKEHGIDANGLNLGLRP